MTDIRDKIKRLKNEQMGITNQCDGILAEIRQLQQRLQELNVKNLVNAGKIEALEELVENGSSETK